MIIAFKNISLYIFPFLIERSNKKKKLVFTSLDLKDQGSLGRNMRKMKEKGYN